MQQFTYPVVLVVSIFLILSSGCSTCFYKTVDPEVVSLNREGVKKLQTGFSKAEVIDILGRPQYTAADKARRLEYWKYQTSNPALTDFALNDASYTILVFRDDILVKYGNANEVYLYTPE